MFFYLEESLCYVAQMWPAYSLPCTQNNINGNSLCSIFSYFLWICFSLCPVFHIYSLERFFLLSSANILLNICVFPLFYSVFSCPVWSVMVSLSHQGLNFEASKVLSRGVSLGDALGASNSREVQSLKCSFDSPGLKDNSGWQRVSRSGLNSTAEGRAMENAEIRPHS